MQNGFAGITPKPLSQSDFLIEDWLVQPTLNLLVRGSVISHLEPKAMQVLVFLAEHPGDVLSKDSVISAVWSDGFVSEQVLTNAIWQIRQGFGEKNRDYIQTIPKSGYRLTARVVPNWAEFQAGYEKALFAVDDPEPVALTPAPPLSPEPAHPRNNLRRIAGVLAMVLLLVSSGLYLVRQKLFGPHRNATIAVLPFKNLSGDPQQEFVSDGMTEELILQLGNLQPQRLGVIARTTTMAYKNSNKRIDQIGKELGVDYILEGGVRREGEVMRVTANLIEVATQHQLWGRNYQQASRDVSLVQSDIAFSIAEQIHLRLSPTQQSQLSHPKSANPAAREEYLQGLYLVGKFSREDIEKALAHYRRAAELDPSYAQPHVGMADAYFIMGQPLRSLAGAPPREYLAKSKEEALRAVQLDPNLGSAHGLLAIATFYHDWDWNGAEAEFRKALELDANSTAAHLYYGLFLTFSGRHQEAAPHIRRAAELDPLRLALVTLTAELYMNARDYDKGLAQANKVLELDPSFQYALDVKFSILLNAGRNQEAAEALRGRIVAGGKEPELASQLQQMFGREGSRGIYKFLLLHVPTDKPIANFQAAMFHAWLGERDRSIGYLEKAYQAHDATLLCIGTHPAFDSLRNEPRFRDLMQRVGIPTQSTG